MVKKIIILGAGIYQVPLIQKAKEIGLYTIVVSIDGDYPGFDFADKIYYNDTTDKEAILRIAIEENIDGICTTGTDVAIVTLGYVCEKLNLPGINSLAGILATDKLPMKKAFEQYGVRTARYRKATSIEDAVTIFKELTPPLMFKATDTSGSRGIIKVDFSDEIENAFDYAYSASKQDYIIIEEYIDGEEFGAQAAVLNNKIEFILPHGDILHHGKTDIPIGHYVPYTLPESVLKDIHQQISLTIGALKLNNCALNFDFILSGSKVYVLEVGARVGATCLAEQVGLYYNIDYYSYIIKLALGISPNISFSPLNPNASLLFISPFNGKFKDISLNFGSYKVVEKQFDYKNGETIKKFEVGPDRIGHIIIEGNSEKEILDNITSIEKEYKVIID